MNYNLVILSRNLKGFLKFNRSTKAKVWEQECSQEHQHHVQPLIVTGKTMNWKLRGQSLLDSVLIECVVISKLLRVYFYIYKWD